LASRVAEDIHHILAISENDGRLWLWKAKLGKQVTVVHHKSCALEKSAVFRFGSASEDISVRAGSTGNGEGDLILGDSVEPEKLMVKYKSWYAWTSCLRSGFGQRSWRNLLAFR